MRNSTLLVFMGIVILVLTFEQTFSSEPPHISATSPVQNELNVSLDTDISITFDVDIDEATINDSTMLVNARSTGLHRGSINYDGPTRTATFSPIIAFDVGEVVSVVLTTGIQAADGTPLAESYTWSFTIRSNDGAGIFVPYLIYPLKWGNLMMTVYAADFDSDNDMDIVVGGANSPVRLFRNNGAGLFAEPEEYDGGKHPFAIVAADLDSDNDLDLAISRGGNSVAILMNEGDGRFLLPVYYDCGSRGLGPSISAADFDGDGDLDLVTAEIRNDEEFTHDMPILMNNGDGTFAEPVFYDFGFRAFCWSVCTADWDADGDVDIAAVLPQTKCIFLFWNNGDGTFSTPSLLHPDGGDPVTVCTADLDGDNDLDLAAAYPQTDSVGILFNDGNGNFDSESVCSAGDTPMSIFPADVEGDGDLDLMVTCPEEVPASVVVLKNRGDGSFVMFPIRGRVPTVGAAPYWLFAADFDGDGDLDAAVVHYNSASVTFLMNLMDVDGDLISNSEDNCPNVYNPDQIDSDEDGTGDCCDPDLADTDEDGVADQCDKCPNDPDPNQLDSDQDGWGDVCDNCPNAPNPDQVNSDGDEYGDCCDPNNADSDTDGVNDQCDNCPEHSNPDQLDYDSDGIGVLCECETANINGLDPVDLSDFAILATQWLLSVPPLSADTNRDGLVDLQDVAQLLQHWLSQCARLQLCLDLDEDGFVYPMPFFCSSTNLDCDDNDPNINPSVSEICDDLIDNDCDGAIDCDDPDCPCMDSDGDGYSDPANPCLYIIDGGMGPRLSARKLSVGMKPQSPCCHVFTPTNIIAKNRERNHQKELGLAWKWG